MPLVPAPRLERIIAGIFRAALAREESAVVVARSLVESELCGLSSHGVMRVARYLGRIKDGTLRPAAVPRVAREDASCAVVDGGWGFGQVAAHFGAEVAIGRCGRHGSAVVSVAQAHHVGRIGEYAESLARAGLAAIVMSAGGERGGSMVVHGSRERLLGTNPLAIALPTPAGHPPLVLDYATAAMAEGRVAVAATLGQPLPPGILIDADGRPTTEAAAFRRGGALLPFGGHKGSALALMIELLATTLAGSVPIALPGYRMGNPTLILAWSVDRFCAPTAYLPVVEALLARIKASAPAEEGREVLLPGELEARCRADRLAHGIPVADALWDELRGAAADVGFDLAAASAG